MWKFSIQLDYCCKYLIECRNLLTIFVQSHFYGTGSYCIWKDEYLMDQNEQGLVNIHVRFWFLMQCKCFFINKLIFREKKTNFAILSWKLINQSNFSMLNTKSYNGIPLLQTNDLAQKERCERKNFFSFRAKTVCFYSAAFGVNQLWSTWIMPYSYGITTLLWLIKFELPNWWNKDTTSTVKSWDAHFLVSEKICVSSFKFIQLYLLNRVMARSSKNHEA